MIKCREDKIRSDCLVFSPFVTNVYCFCLRIRRLSYADFKSISAKMFTYLAVFCTTIKLQTCISCSYASHTGELWKHDELIFFYWRVVMTDRRQCTVCDIIHVPFCLHVIDRVNFLISKLHRLQTVKFFTPSSQELKTKLNHIGHVVLM